MGRAKLNMELITKEKSRITTFKKRKQGLIRKMHEFKTLCDVSACMIIYGPKQETGSTAEPEIWPQDPDEVRRIIGIYKSKNRDSGNKAYGLSDFFHDRSKKKEEELTKLRKKITESKYPTWLEFMNFMAESGLRDFAARLGNKADYVRSRIGLLRRNKQGINILDNYNNYYHNNYSYNHHQISHVDDELEDFKVVPNIHYFPGGGTSSILDDDHHQYHHRNTLMMLLMNGNYNDSYYDHPQVFHRGGDHDHQSMAAGTWGVVDDPAVVPRFLTPYYGPSVPMRVPPPSQYEQMLQYYSSTWDNNSHINGGDQDQDQEGVCGSSQYHHQMNYNNMMIGRY